MVLFFLLALLSGWRGLDRLDIRRRSTTGNPPLAVYLRIPPHAWPVHSLALSAHVQPFVGKPVRIWLWLHLGRDVLAPWALLEQPVHMPAELSARSDGLHVRVNPGRVERDLLAFGEPATQAVDDDLLCLRAHYRLHAEHASRLFVMQELHVLPRPWHDGRIDLVAHHRARSQPAARLWSFLFRVERLLKQVLHGWV